MANYHGRRGRIYLGTGGVATPMVDMAEWTLDWTTDMVDTTALDDTNKTNVKGLPSVGGTFSGFWDDTYDNLWKAADSNTAVNMYLYPSLDAVTIYWYGTAWVDWSLAGGVADAVKVSGNFSAANSWARKP